MIIVTRQHAFCVHIPIGGKTHFTHPIPCLSDTEQGTNLINKYLMAGHFLSKIIKRITKPIYAATKSPLKRLRKMSFYLVNVDRNTTTLFSVVRKLVVDVLSGKSSLTSRY